MSIQLRKTAGVIAAAACAAVGTVSCSTAEQQQAAAASRADGRQCFLASQVNGFHAMDDDTVHVRVGARDVYELQIAGTCLNVNWAQRIGIRPTGGSSWVCRGLDAELLVPDQMGGQRCLVRAVRQLSEAEAEALRQTR